MPLYVQDFLTDEKLNECSASATGVYIKIMCLMHKQPVYGSILLGQKDKQTSDQIKNFAIKFVKHLPYDSPTIEVALTELIKEDVLQLSGDLLSQKRMMVDGELSITRSRTGKLGGEKTKENLLFARAKNAANTEYEYEGDIENEDVLKELNVPFEKFWALYDKKVGEKDKLARKWASLKNADREAAMKHIQIYKIAQPDKTYRKNPSTYLNNKSWNDEIIASKNGINGKANNGNNSGGLLPNGQDATRINREGAGTL